MEKVALVSLDEVNLKLIIFDYDSGYYNIKEEIVENLKLGKDILEDSIIKPHKLAEALEIIKMYRKLCDNYGVEKVSAVATPTFKNARNHRSFFEEIYNNTAINFNILTRDEEYKNIYTGVVNFVDVQKGLILDVEPYNVHFVYYNRKNVLSAHSLDFGALSLADAYAEVENLNEKWDLMVKHINENLEKLPMSRDEEIHFIGTGSMYISLGKVAKKVTKYPLDLDNNYIVTSETADNVIKLIKGLDPDKTKKIKGISEERADVLLAGLAIIKCINDFFKIPQITITVGGYKDGIINTSSGVEFCEKPLGDMLGYSLETINKFYSNNSNSSQIYNIALILFRQLKVLHKLPRNYVKALRIGAALYDSGKRIRYDNNSKYAFDVIINSRINGVSQKDLLLGAFACLCQNLDNFNLSDWVRYNGIVGEEDLDAVRKLGVIINLASALDTSKSGNVTDICCDILGDSIIVKTIVKSDAKFDIDQAMKYANDFKKVFKRSIQII